MFSKLLKRRAPIKAPVSPAVPDEAVVWAIGDVHGRLDLLEPMVSAIMADAQDLPSLSTTAIFLGDYIDRGPCSRQVIQLLAHLPKDRKVDWRFLKGNHEKAMLDFLARPSEGAKWCEYGGDATLRSYGLRVPQMKHKPEVWTHLSADLNHKVTPAERAFLERLELSISVGDYFFAHAGARPGEPLDRQADEDLMWIRRTFLDSDIEFEKVVVHGHTPSFEVQADHRRIGIDTKAYESGVLTALRLSGTDRTFVQVVIDGAQPSVRITPRDVAA